MKSGLLLILFTTLAVCEEAPLPADDAAPDAPKLGQLTPEENAKILAELKAKRKAKAQEGETVEPQTQEEKEAQVARQKFIERQAVEKKEADEALQQRARLRAVDEQQKKIRVAQDQIEKAKDQLIPYNGDAAEQKKNSQIAAARDRQEKKIEKMEAELVELKAELKRLNYEAHKDRSIKENVPNK